MSSPTTRSRSALILALAALASPAFAQDRLDDVPATSAERSLDADTAMLDVYDGELWGLGSDYKVRFETDGLTYHPALGADEPESRTLSVQVTAVGRGVGGSVAVGAPVARERDGLRVDYHRPTCVETYEIRPEGVKQSFRFDALPQGGGDLVVTARVECNMPLSHADAESVRFATPRGEVFVEGVLGIDADGLEAAGSLRYVDGLLEMRLPASFVAHAALPLVLDPLLGSNTDPSTGTTRGEERIKSAYDETNEVWCLVWDRTYSSSDSDVLARRMNRDGTFRGSAVSLMVDTTKEEVPAIANVNRLDRFLILWRWQDNNPEGLTLDAANGTRTAIVDLGAGDNFAVGDNPNTDATFGSHVPYLTTLVVTDSSGDNGFAFGGTIKFNGSGEPYVVTVGGVGQTRFSTAGTRWCGGPTVGAVDPLGWSLFAWSLDTGSAGNGDRIREIEGAFRDVNGGNVIGQDSFLLSGSYGHNRSSQNPHIANSGDEWICVYQSKRLRSGADDPNEVHASTLVLDAGRNALRTRYGITVAAESGRALQAGRVGWQGDSVLLAYTRERSNGTGAARVVLLSMPDADVCTDEEVVTPNGEDVRSMWVATRHTGLGVSPTGRDEESLITFGTTGSRNGVFLRQYRHDDGDTANLGGGCQAGGTANAQIQDQCAVIGNANHRVLVRGANPGGTAYLLIGTELLRTGCKNCRLFPDPFSSFVVGASIDSDGYASVALPIPDQTALRGLTLYEQWILPGVNGPSCFVGASVTDALSVTIQ